MLLSTKARTSDRLFPGRLYNKGESNTAASAEAGVGGPLNQRRQKLERGHGSPSHIMARVLFFLLTLKTTRHAHTFSSRHTHLFSVAMAGP